MNARRHCETTTSMVDERRELDRRCLKVPRDFGYRNRQSEGPPDANAHIRGLDVLCLTIIDWRTLVSQAHARALD